MAEPWVSVDEVAAHLGVRKDSIYRWIERRGLPALKIGKLWKLKLSEVDDWARAHGANGAHTSAMKPNGKAAKPNGKAVKPNGNGLTPRSDPKHFVLTVDDDESIRATLSDFLSDEGYGALEAGDGFEALDILSSPDTTTPSLIILDLGMPHMDGWAFREELGRDPALAEIPFIIVTADRRAEVAGAAAVLRKPLDLDQLEDAIRRAIE